MKHSGSNLGGDLSQDDMGFWLGEDEKGKFSNGLLDPAAGRGLVSRGFLPDLFL